MNLKDVYEAAEKSIQFQQTLPENKHDDDTKLDNNLGDMLSEKKHSFYPESYQVPKELDHIEREDISSFKPVQMQSIEKDQYIMNDRNRIISSATGISASQLFEYVPATKIKGLCTLLFNKLKSQLPLQFIAYVEGKDDFVFESEHYGYYTQGADFVVKKEKESLLNFPEKLLLYTFEEGSFTKFPRAKKGSTQVLGIT